VFTGHLRARWRGLVLTAIYLPALTFVVLGIVYVPHEPAEAAWGWVLAPVTTMPGLVCLGAAYAWGLALAVLSLRLCIVYALRSATPQTRKMGKHVSIGLACVVVPSFLSEALLPLVLQRPVLELTATSCAIMGAFVTYAIVKYQLFPLTPVVAAESIVSTISDPLFLVDLDHNIRTVNRAACVMLGYQTHELLGHTIGKVLSGPVAGDTHTDFMKRLQTGVVSDVETEFVTKDGARVPVSLSWSVTRTPDGKMLGVTFIGRNISERIRLQDSLRKARDELQARVEEQTRELTVTNRMLREEIGERMKAEEQLADDKEYLTVTLRSIADGVIATDDAGRVTLLNRVAEELTGWKSDEAHGRVLGEVFALQDEESGKALGDPWAAMTTVAAGAIHQAEGTLTARDGTKRTVAESAALISHQSGKVRGMALVFRDVTERRKLQERMFKARRLESVNALAAGIARDFGNVFAQVMNFLFMVRPHLPPEGEASAMLERTEASALHASTLTRQLLSLAGEAPPSRNAVATLELVKDAAEFSLAKLKNPFSVEIAEAADHVYVDRGQIDQALQAVILNAAEAMAGDGTVRIRAERRRVDAAQGLPLADGEYVVIAVSDDGAGIAKENLHRVSDPFYTTKEGHTGLGLTMAFGMLSKHEGCVDVESEPGKGTTVHLYVPGHVPQAAEAPSLPDGAEDTAPVEVHLLFMDDQESVRASTARLLKHLGYLTEVASDGDEAARMYREAGERGEPFDVVILDLVIEGGKGALQTLAEMKRMDPQVRAIVCSAYTTDPAMERYADLGFAGALVKPFTVQGLDGAVRAALRTGE